LPGKDTNIGAKRAREARAELGLGAEPLDCLLTTVEGRLEIPVIAAELPEQIDGCCWRDGAATILWLNGTRVPVRQRFTLAHELGHLRCAHVGSIPPESFLTLNGKQTDSREIQANAFAAEFLAPAAGITAHLGGREAELEDVVGLAILHRISSIAALYRLNSLGLTSRYEDLKAAIEAGEDDPIWEKLAPEYPDDLIEGLSAGSLPRLSPGLQASAFASAIGGTTSIGDAAAATGCDPDALSAAVASIGA